MNSVSSAPISAITSTPNLFSSCYFQINPSHDIVTFRSLHKYFQSNGIGHRIPCPHTHEQNKHHHVVEMGLALPSFLKPACHTNIGQCISMACFLINCLPTPILSNLSPFGKLLKHALGSSMIWIFGREC